MILISRIYGTDTTWMDTLYARIPNLNDYFYAFADHPYWYGHSPEGAPPPVRSAGSNVLRKRMNEKGASAKPIWITEYGESTANCGEQCVSEATQAEHLQKILNAAITRDRLEDRPDLRLPAARPRPNSSDREHGFGLLRYDGTQKPAYSMVRALMQQYR